MIIFKEIVQPLRAIATCPKVMTVFVAIRVLSLSEFSAMNSCNNLRKEITIRITILNAQC